jgi:GGDEF domain-containing protein
VLGKIAKRLEKIVSRSGIAWWGDDLTVTLSVEATAAAPGDTAETILERACQALMQSVENGGNCVTIVLDEINQAHS